jgi:hypothetical protein
MPAKPNPGDLNVFTKDEVRRHSRPVFVEWYRCDETGRKLGVLFRAWQLFVIVSLHRPTALDPEWAGLGVWWGLRTLIDTHPKPQ